MSQTYRCGEPLITETGARIENIEIAYHTYGTLNAAADNVVWVCHALTANSDVADWWPDTVAKGRFLDPERYFVVCANVLGSCYGTTGPASVNQATGKRWGMDFPTVTVRDMVELHRRLADHLGLRRIKLLIGSSLGGFQCMEWAITEPERIENLVLIATSTYSRPWAAAFNESQRMALDADPTLRDRDNAAAGAAGLACARSIAMLSYRGGTAYDLTQADDAEHAGSTFSRRVHSYQRHQGQKLVKRFDAASYYRITQAVDSHNVGRGRGSVAEALAAIKARTMVIAITGDILFPPADHADMAAGIAGCRYEVIDSNFGHDGFLIENELLDRLIKDFLNN